MTSPLANFCVSLSIRASPKLTDSHSFYLSICRLHRDGSGGQRGYISDNKVCLRGLFA
ncbi:protein of unknown function [Shewanella benthica]|uniref:Uncharacterized protein n=1 Tax=Shewanella benthica TaxID=43661 RepID=A0A330M384_9GAMM|nr:protein of unknown function [Shewanella benthica]